MPQIVLQPLSMTDARELLAFELENRAFFESGLPARGDDYYTLENVERTVRESIRDREEGAYYMYLVRGPEGAIVGRVNLYNVRRGPVQAAELGYRIARDHNGKGYATQAVALALADAFGAHGFHRVEAATSPDNIGSQIVLVKNGFQFVGRTRRSMQVHGRWQDSVLFERLEQPDE